MAPPFLITRQHEKQAGVTCVGHPRCETHLPESSFDSGKLRAILQVVNYRQLKQAASETS